MKIVEVSFFESLSEKDVKLAIAIEAFIKGSVSVEKAAEIAKLPLQSFLEELRKRGHAAYQYSYEELGLEYSSP